MVTNKKAPQKNKRSTKKAHSKTVVAIIKLPLTKINLRSRSLLTRRPHRTFKRTMRRDYARSLQLPGYWSFTSTVHQTLWKHRKLIASLVIVYALLSALLVGLASQDTYTILSDTLRSTSGDIFQGNMGELGKAGLLFLTAMTGGLSQSLTEVQQIYAAILGLMVWLTSVWLLRNILAGHKVRLRDGLYNAGAPILSTFILFVVMLVQLLPFAIALLGYSAATQTGLLNGGVEAMVFWLAASLLTILSLYWMTSTTLALVIVTLPGMYPFKALQTAGDIVLGRRLRILLRLLWMSLIILVVWTIIMIPVILLDTWVKGFWQASEWFPTIPVALLVMSSLTIVWSSSYIYLLYRRIVADESSSH